MYLRFYSFLAYRRRTMGGLIWQMNINDNNYFRSFKDFFFQLSNWSLILGAINRFYKESIKIPINKPMFAAIWTWIIKIYIALVFALYITVTLCHFVIGHSELCILFSLHKYLATNRSLGYNWLIFICKSYKYVGRHLSLNNINVCNSSEIEHMFGATYTRIMLVSVQELQVGLVGTFQIPNEQSSFK